jgi:hypothetical protein
MRPDRCSRGAKQNANCLSNFQKNADIAPHVGQDHLPLHPKQFIIHKLTQKFYATYFMFVIRYIELFYLHVHEKLNKNENSKAYL